MAEKNTGSLNLIEQAVLNRISQGEIKGKIHQLAMPYKELMAYYQRDKEAVLLWIAGIIPLESLYNIPWLPSSKCDHMC